MAAGDGGKERRSSACVFTVVLALLVAHAARHPRYEWDLLGYVGVVLSWSASEVDVQPRTYAALAQVAPETAVRELSSSSPYRATVASDARAFHEQLGFYRGRLGYTLPIGALAQLGLSPVRAAFLVSLLGAVLSAVVVFAWCAQRAPPWSALGLAWLILLASGWLETARLATPDALATGCVLLGAWCLVERQRAGRAALAFLAAVATRPDAALLVLALWWGARLPRPTHAWRGWRRYELVPLVVLALVLLGGARFGWWTVFVHTFDGWLVQPSAVPPFSFELYARTVAAHVGEWSSAPPLFVATGVALVLFGQRCGDEPVTRRVASAVALALVLRFALFPALWPRLCQAHVALAGLLAVDALAALRRSARGPA